MKRLPCLNLNFLRKFYAVRSTLVAVFVVSAVLQTLLACASLRGELLEGERPPGMPPASVQAVEMPLRVVPLPGNLDKTLVFNSNSPEIITEPGIVLSTLPAPQKRPATVFQNVPFSGEFSVFSHHIARDVHSGARRLHLGLLVHNRSARPVALKLTAGASYLSQPDALFKRLKPLLPDPRGEIFAGPGDRVAGELLRGRSPLKPRMWEVAPGTTELLLNLAIPTNVALPPPINGRTTQLHFRSDGPVYLSEVAVFAKRHAAGSFETPTKSDFMATLALRKRAGALEPAATPFSAAASAPRGFRYGRVGGVTRGATWYGDLSPDVMTLAPRQTIGFPLAAVYLNRLGTRQIQSAPLVSRYPETAFQGHGNYGVTYRLTLRLRNPSNRPRSYSLRLQQPGQVFTQGAEHIAVYKKPPDNAVTFRGLVRIDEDPEKGHLSRFTHIVLRKGQTLPPFETVGIPGRGERNLLISLIYPADATPPQLLTIQRI